MNCIKCGQELKEGAKFCRFCGQNQIAPVEQGAPVQTPPVAPPQAPPVGTYQTPPVAPSQAPPPYQAPPVQNYAPGGTVPPQQNGFDIQDTLGKIQGKLPKTDGVSLGGLPPVAIAGIAVGVVAVLCLGGMLFRSDSVKVAAAFASTSKQIEKEVTSIQQDLPVYDFFKNYDKDEFQVEYLSDSRYTPSMLLEIDYGKKQTKVTAWNSDMEVDVMISDKYTTMSNSMMSDVFGFDNKTLGADLNRCAFIDFPVSEDLSFDPYSYDTGLIDEFNDVFGDFAADLIKSAEVEKVADQTYRINGSREDLDTYEVSVDADDLEDAMESAIETIMKNKSIKEQLMQMYILEQTSNYGYINNELRDVEGTIEDMMYDFMEDFVDEYRYLSENYIVVQVHGGKIVRMATPGRDGSNVSIMFTNTKNLLDEIVLESYGWVQTYSFSSDGDKFVFETGNEYGTNYKLEYVYEGRSNNVTLKEGNYSESFTVNTTTKDTMIISTDDDFKVEIIKNNLDSGWFVQDSKFERILTYTESELEQMMRNMF